MDAIKFSLIVPVFNVEKYLARCLNSLLNQNYDNFEIVCVNDGSSDNSYDILQEYQLKYPSKIKVINQENLGLGGARNTGVAHAEGDYIWFIDSDDWIEKDSLFSLNQYLNNEGLKDMVIFDYYRSKSFAECLGLKSVYVPFNCFKVQKYVNHLLSYNATFSACCRIYRLSVYKKSGFYFQKGFYEDVGQICLISNFINSIGYLRKNLYHYFVNDSSIMKTYDLRILDIFNQVLFVVSNIKYNQYIPYFIARSVYSTYEKLDNASFDVKRSFYNYIRENNIFKFSALKIFSAADVSYLSRIKIFIYLCLIKFRTIIIKK